MKSVVRDGFSKKLTMRKDVRLEREWTLKVDACLECWSSSNSTAVAVEQTRMRTVEEEGQLRDKIVWSVANYRYLCFYCQWEKPLERLGQSWMTTVHAFEGFLQLVTLLRTGYRGKGRKWENQLPGCWNSPGRRWQLLGQIGGCKKWLDSAHIWRQSWWDLLTDCMSDMRERNSQQLQGVWSQKVVGYTCSDEM